MKKFIYKKIAVSMTLVLLCGTAFARKVISEEDPQHSDPSAVTSTVVQPQENTFEPPYFLDLTGSQISKNTGASSSRDPLSSETFLHNSGGSSLNLEELPFFQQQQLEMKKLQEELEAQKQKIAIEQKEIELRKKELELKEKEFELKEKQIAQERELEKILAEQQRIREEAEAQRLREAEEQRIREEAEAQRIREEAEAQRIREAEAQRIKEAEAQRIKEEAEAQRIREAEAQRIREEAEAQKAALQAFLQKPSLQTMGGILVQNFQKQMTLEAGNGTFFKGFFSNKR